MNHEERPPQLPQLSERPEMEKEAPEPGLATQIAIGGGLGGLSGPLLLATWLSLSNQSAGPAGYLFIYLAAVVGGAICGAIGLPVLFRLFGKRRVK